MSTQKYSPQELELKDLTQTNGESNQNQFAPYVNLQKYFQQKQSNQNNNNNYYYAEFKEEQDQNIESKFDNFKQYISNIQSNFSEESVGCQFFTICNSIICFIILCVIIKSL